MKKEIVKEILFYLAVFFGSMIIPAIVIGWSIIAYQQLGDFFAYVVR